MNVMLRTSALLVALTTSACQGRIGSTDGPDEPSPIEPAEPTDPSDPANVDIELASRAATPFRGQMMGRHYVDQMLREIFFPDTPGDRDRRMWDRAMGSIMATPSTFGRACDPYGSRSATDCEEDILVVTSSEMSPASTVVRQVEKLNVCEQLLHQGEFVRTAASRAGADGERAPSADDVEAVWRLFYRADDPEPDDLAPLNDMLDALQRAGVKPMDQWRGLLQLVCEQPGWEIV